MSSANVASDAEVVEWHLDGLQFHKLEFRGPHVVYGAKVPSMFQSNDRFVFATVDTTRHVFALAETTPLSGLPWDSVQTRLVARGGGRYQRAGPAQRMRVAGRGAPDAALRVIDRTAEKTTYRSTSGQLLVELLHNPSKATMYQYNNTIGISSALDTFQAVITRV